MPPAGFQYRYHPDWAQVRGELKAAGSTPSPRRCRPCAVPCAGGVGEKEPTRSLAHGAPWWNWWRLTALRAGGEAYAKENGTRGATALLKSGVRIDGEQVTLTFKGKGGKRIVK